MKHIYLRHILHKPILTLSLLVALTLFFIPTLQAQFRISTGPGAYPAGWTPETLVRNYLAAPNIDISNVTFNGIAADSALRCSHIGYFNTRPNARPNRLGIESGIVLSTGNAGTLLAETVNMTDDAGSSRDYHCRDFSDPTLNSMVADTTGIHDVAVLEFDFVPHSDHFGFTFVFASEEYPDCVCSKFNDIFGFFLTGPKPGSQAGYNNENVAVIRDTLSNSIALTPITINTINGGRSGDVVRLYPTWRDPHCDTTHSAYYRNNPRDPNYDQYDPSTWPDTFYTGHDGMTTVISIQVPVVACEQYHIKIGIADVKDIGNDSDLLIQMNSFSSDSLVRIHHEYSVCDNSLPYVWQQGDTAITFTEAGNQYYHHGSYATCDTLETLSLHVGATTRDTIAATACEQYHWYAPIARKYYYSDEFYYSQYYSQSGTYASTLRNGNNHHCDSVITLNLTIHHKSYGDVYDTVLQNDTPVDFLGHHCSHSGTYNITLGGQNQWNCDSIIRYHLLVLPNLYRTVWDTICDNEIDPVYDWDGTLFPRPTGGHDTTLVLHDTLLTTYGTDSIVTRHLTIHYRSYSSVHAAITENQLQNYSYHGCTFGLSGVTDTVIHLSNRWGCDSAITFTLIVYPNVTARADSTICINQLPLTWNGHRFTEADSHTVTLRAHTGADSLLTMTVHLLDTIATTWVDTACDNYTFGNTQYHASGHYSQRYVSVNGCDSVAHLWLTIQHSRDTSIRHSVIENALPYTFCNIAFTNDVEDTLLRLSTLEGCDSTINFSLVVHRNQVVHVDSAICLSAFLFVWNDSIFTTADTKSTRLFSQRTGADSVVVMHLAILPDSYSTVYDTIVENQLPYHYHSYIFADTVRDSVITIENHYGCDSIVTYSLFVHRNVQASADSTLCENFLPLQWNHSTFTDSGTQRDTLVAHTGADSVLSMHLTVLHNSYNTVYDTIVENDLPWQFCGTTFADSVSLATVVIPNTVGCDSIITYSLYVHRNIVTILDSTLCENFLPLTWNDSIFTNDGEKHRTYSSHTGADSLVIMRLHVLRNSYSHVSDTLVENDLPYGYHGYIFGDNVNDSVLVIPSQCGCDSIVTYSLFIHWNVAATADSTLCENFLPLQWNHSTFTDSGTQVDTLVAHTGADSVLTMTVTVLHNSYSTVHDTIVENDLPWHFCDTTFADSVSHATVIIPNTAGCDSIITYSLHVHRNIRTVLDSSICENYLPVVWNDSLFTTDGVKQRIYRSHTGADSVVVMRLLVLRNSSARLEHAIVENDLPFLWEDSIFATHGEKQFVIPNAAGCDSVVTLSLHVWRNITVHRDSLPCQSALPLLWNGVAFATDSIASVTLHSAGSHGEDSTVVMQVQIIPTTYATVYDTLVENQLPYDYHGWRFTGPVQDSVVSIANARGCDSIVTLSLHIHWNVYDTITMAVCENDLPIIWNGVYCTQSITTRNIIPAHNGADSILVMTLIVYENAHHTVHDTIVENQLPYLFNNIPFEQPVHDTLIALRGASRNGCDSLIHYSLHIYYNQETFDTATVCDNLLPYLWNGISFSAAGDSVRILPTVHGADSLIHMHLDVPRHSSSTIHEAIVENRLPHLFAGTWLQHAVSDTTLIITNTAGCDSIISYSLQVHPNITVADSLTICSSLLPYTWNGIVFDSAGHDSATLLRTTGADSVVQMTLHVKPSHRVVEQHEACGSFTWRNGITYTASNDTDTLLFFNRYQCDSVIALDLTIWNLTQGPDLYDTICITQLPYSTLDTLFQPGTESGDYPFVMPGSNGCDSLSTLHLTVLDLPLLEVEEIAFDCSRRRRVLVVRHTDATTSVAWHCTPADSTLAGQESHDTLRIAPHHITTYYATAQVEPFICANSKAVTVDPIPPLKARIEAKPPFASPDKLTIQLRDDSRGSIAERQWWLPGHIGTEPSISYAYPFGSDSIEVRLVVTEAVRQCHDTAWITIPYRGGVLWVPNAFTPDKETNTIFRPEIVGLVTYEMHIYTRAGQLVFHTTHLDEGWDGTYNGKDCLQENYVYRIRYTTQDAPRELKNKVGNILLIR